MSVPRGEKGPSPPGGEKGPSRPPRRYSASATPSCSHTAPSDIDFVNLVSQLDTLELPSKRQTTNGKRKRKSNQSVRFDVPDDISENKETSKRRRHSPVPFKRKNPCITPMEVAVHTAETTKETREVDDELGDVVSELLSETGLQATQVTIYERHVEFVTLDTEIQYADTGIPREPLNRNNNAANSSLKFARKKHKQSTRKCMSDTSVLNRRQLLKKTFIVSRNKNVQKLRNLTKKHRKPRTRKQTCRAQGDGCHSDNKKKKIQKQVIGRKFPSSRRTKSSRTLTPKHKKEKRKKIVKLTYQAKRSVLKNKEFNRVNKSVAEKLLILKMSIEQLWKEYKTAKCSRIGNSFFSTMTRSDAAKQRWTLKNMWKDYQKLKQKKRKRKIIPIKRRGDPFELSEDLRIDLVKYLTFKNAENNQYKCCTKQCWTCWEEVDWTYIREEYGED